MAETAPLPTASYKLVLLGDSAVGKSSSVNRFVKDEFLDHQQPTIGAAFMTQSVKLKDMVVKFEIWDTAGQERYRSLAPMYYRGAACALVVFDITDKKSFAGAQTWIRELMNQGSPDIVIALAGNKSDLDSKRQVAEAEGKQFAQENGCIYMETSAKTGANIHNIFEHIASRLPSRIASESSSVQLNQNNHNNLTASCCQ